MPVVEFGRCLCIHSLSQALDTILQVLLYQRQIIPEPVHLLPQSECPKAQLFKTAYDEVGGKREHSVVSIDDKRISLRSQPC